MNVQASFTNFEYEQGSGPSNSQSFAINYEGLTDAIQINTVAPVSAMEFSLDSVGWSASIDTANTYSGTGTLTAYTRLKSGLSSSLYNGQFYVSFPQDGDAIPVNYNAAVKVPQQNVTIAGFYHPLRTFFGYPSASQYVSNPQEIVVNVKNPTFTSMSIVVTSSYELCIDRDPNTPFFFTSSVSQSIITASGITNDYSLRFWMRLRSGSAGSVDTTLTVRDQNNNTLTTASIAGRRYAGSGSIDCWNEAANVDVLWRNIGTNGVTAYFITKHLYYENPTLDFVDYVSSSFITRDEWDEYFNRSITSQQNLHVRIVTPTTTLTAKSFTTSSQTFFPEGTATSAWWLDSARIPTTPEFVTIRFQFLEPELVYGFRLNTNLTGLFNSPVSVTGINQLKYLTFPLFRGSQISTIDIQSSRLLAAFFGSAFPTDTNGFLDTIKLPNKVGYIQINAARGGKRNPYYYPKTYSKISQTLQNTPLNNVYEERGFLRDRLIDNISQDGFIDTNTIEIELNNIPLPETSDLSIYPNLKELTLANLTGSLTTLYIPQTLTTLSISGSPVSYSINQEAPYSGAINTFNLFQSASVNIQTNYDAFITNLRFTTSSQFILTRAPTSSLPAIPSAVTASIVGGGPFDEMNIRTFYTPGQPTMSILNVNGTGMTYTPNISMSFDTSVGDLKTVTITNMTASYDVDLSNLVSASINVVSGARNITLPTTYANDNQTIRIDSRNLENIYIPINANYSGSRNTTLGLIPGFAIDTLDLSGSFITNLTVSSSGYFNSFRRLLGGFETIRNYNFQFSSFDAGGVEYFLSQVSASGPNTNNVATSGNTGSLVDSTQNWTTNQYQNTRVKMLDGSGNTTIDVITSNTSSSLSLGRMVAGGGFSPNNGLAYSDDGGLTWTGLGTSMFTSTFGIAYNGIRFVAVGAGAPNYIAWSDDGITWNGSGGRFFGGGMSIVWNGNIWVAGGVASGGDSLAYSTDGINWNFIRNSSSVMGDVRSIAWNGTRFVAVGNDPTNTIAHSTDGINWIGLGKSIFTAVGYGIAWNGTRFVAVGQGTNTIAHSTDGITWTGLGGIIFTGGSAVGYGIAWNGTRFVAVGSSTSNTIAWSNDGITWNGLGTSIFSTLGYGVAWNGTRFVAVGTGTANTIAHSTDGITWTGLGNIIFTGGGYGQSVASTTPFNSLTPNIGIVPTAGTQYLFYPDKIIDLRNQKNGLYISPAISSSKATLEGLGWTVNL